MALFGLKFKSSKDDGQPDSPGSSGVAAGKAGSGGGSGGGYKPDPRKASKFFHHGEVTADARNFDYSIECYINGLRHDIDNRAVHEALLEVGRRRKVAGGKPASVMERHKPARGAAWERMLHYEKLWAMDPTDASMMLAMMQQAVAADAELGESVNLSDLAYWVGEQAVPAIRANKGGDAKQFLKARDLFREIGAYDKAVEACKLAVSLKPNDSKLLAELRELEAEAYSARTTASDAEAGVGGVDFRRNIKDAETQRALEQEDSSSKAERVVAEMISRRRAELEEDPTDADRVGKLVDALLRRPSPETEAEAISVLEKAFEDTGQYRFKVRVGDIRMRQMSRMSRELRDQAAADPSNAELKSRFDDARRKQLAFELSEYEERVKNYPTDMSLRFELGRRLLMAGRFDDAIGAFQEAKADPKRRSQAMLFLGQCYFKKGWFDEAVDTLREGIASHAVPDDKTALEMKYLLMDALAGSARQEKDAEKAGEARKLCSEIIQADINYRDIKTRMEEMKALVDELKAG